VVIVILRMVWALLACWGVLCVPLAQAQGRPAGAQKPAAKPGAVAAAKPAAVPVPSGPGWKVGPAPAWVVQPPSVPDSAMQHPVPALASMAPGARGDNSPARRELLVDSQQRFDGRSRALFFRVREMATDASTLGQVSQPRIEFNPAFQTVVLHDATLWRDGKRLDRLKDARLELLRREQQLDQQVITGTQTLLVVLSDVRVGEPVELSYTIEGQNPIFEGRISAWMQLASDVPVAVLHQRVLAPANKTLHTKLLGTDLTPERQTVGDMQELRLVRHNVPPVVPEAQAPPWHRQYPWIQITEYANWAEVDSWAQRLFARTTSPQPALAEPLAAWRAKGLQGQALVAEVLRFVQDEVRYFSVSLGESSHRPKAAERTLAERLGDCKDKVQLFNALLAELGIAAQPALVSVQRNRGVANYLPTPELFDHVVSRVEVEGQVYFLDPTITGQGLTLQGRGHHPYGRALVVGAGAELNAVPEASFAVNRLEFEQLWDVSKPGAAVQLTVVMRAHGSVAEQMRALRATAGEQRLSEGLAGLHLRMAPGLLRVGEPLWRDDRTDNLFELTQRFEHPELGSYDSGGLDLEYAAAELFDSLVGPAEAQRRTPFVLDQPRRVDSRVTFIPPRGWSQRTLPTPQEVVDKHLRFGARAEFDGNKFSILRRVERRLDEVLPAELPAYRENINRMRQMVGGRVRLPLVDFQALEPEMQALERRLRGSRGWRADTLGSILMRSEAMRLIDGKVLEGLPDTSPLRAKVLASRAASANLLGEFGQGLRDADAALAIKADFDLASDARGVALLGLGRAEEALAEFKRVANRADGSTRTAAQKWVGAIQLHLGRPAEAEQALRDVVDSGGGDEREFALLWLHAAAERQGAGRGKQAIAPHVDGVDAKKLTGALLRFLAGQLDRDALIRSARERADMERLNLAEAYFFIGQQLMNTGQREEAQRWFNRVVETGATPYREVTFAKLELQRLAAR
jgi:lipoprotein NlpI